MPVLSSEGIFVNPIDRDSGPGAMPPSPPPQTHPTTSDIEKKTQTVANDVFARSGGLPPPPPTMGPPPPPPRDVPPPPQTMGPRRDVPPPPQTPPPMSHAASGPLLSAKGEPIVVQPGWTPEQSKVLQDLRDRFPKVAKTFGESIDPKNASPQNVDEARRFTAGGPALDAITSKLEDLASRNLDGATKQTRANEEFAKVADLDKFVSGIQQRDNITDNGVKKLPLLNEQQSKEYAERMAYSKSTLSAIDKAMDPKSRLPLEASRVGNPVELARGNAYLMDLPRQLKELEQRQPDPAKRQTAVNNLMQPMAEIDKKLLDANMGLASHEIAVQNAPPRQEPGALSRAWSKVKDFGSRAADAIASIPDRIKATFARDTQTAQAPPNISIQPTTTPASHAVPQVADDKAKAPALDQNFQRDQNVQNAVREDRQQLNAEARQKAKEIVQQHQHEAPARDLGGRGF